MREGRYRHYALRNTQHAMPSPNDNDDIFSPEFLSQLERLAILARNLHRARRTGMQRDPTRGLTVEFKDYRPYVVGDDFRTIDWSIFCRLDRLFVRLMEAEHQLPVYILLDASRSMLLGQPNKFLHARRIAAALGYVAIANQDRVALNTFGDRLVPRLKTQHGKGEVHKLLRALRDLEAHGPTALPDCVGTFARSRLLRGTVLVLSDFLDSSKETGPAAALEALRSLVINRFEIVAVQVVAPEDQNPQFFGELDLADCETDDRHPLFLTPDMAQRYRELFNGYVAELAEYCTRHGMTHVLAPTSESLEDVVLGLLKRGVLGT